MLWRRLDLYFQAFNSGFSLPDKVGAAIDVQQLAGHKVAFGRGQKQNSAHQVILNLDPRQ